MTRRGLLAILGAFLLAAVAVTYSVFTTTHARTPVAAADGMSLSGPRIMFRSTAAGSRGRLAMVARSDPGGPRSVSALTCSRVYAAGGTGTCLRQDGALTTYQ